jgi:AraC family transcriptional regulator
MTCTALLPERETHAIPSLRQNRLLADSRGLGWNSVYVSLTAERPWSAELQARPHDCLVYCLSGQAHIERRIEGVSDADDATLKPRMFSVIPSDHRSNWSIRGTPEIVLIYLHRRLKDELTDAAAAHALVPRLAQFDPLLEQMGVALLGCLSDRRPLAARYAEQLARTAMCHLLAHHVDNRQAAPEQAVGAAAGVRRAIDYLQACLAEPLTVETLAGIAGASVPRFVRTFKSATGLTPYRYLLNARIDRARQLLAATRKPVSEIALDTGFPTPSHFASTFHRQVGVTPSAYRLAH